MKKFTLLLCALFVAIFANAQEILKADNFTSVESLSKVKPSNSHLKNNPTPVWSVNFDEAIPTWTMGHAIGTKDWTVGSETDRPCYWGPVNPDNTGWNVYSMDYLYEVMELGECGSYAYLDLLSDRTNSITGMTLPDGCVWNGTGQSPYNAYIQFDDINLTEVEVPLLKFHNSYRASNPSYFYSFVEYSLDNGATWTSIEVNKVSDLDSFNMNSGEITMGLPALANQNDVSIRFRHESDEVFSQEVFDQGNPSSWAWLIDDVRVYDYTDFGINHDLVVYDTRITFFDYIDYTDLEYAGFDAYHYSSYYGQVPVDQFANANLYFNLALQNWGANTVTPKANVKVLNPEMTEVYNQVVDGNSLSFTSYDTIDIVGIPCALNDPMIGKYLVIFKAFTDGAEDDNPDDNVDTAYFYVTPNTFSREAFDITGSMSPQNWSDGGNNGDGVGTTFNVYYEGEIVHSVDVFVDAESTVGTEFYVEINSYNSDTQEYSDNLLTSYPIEVEESMLGQWVNCTFPDEYTVEFPTDQNYIQLMVGVKINYNGSDFYIGKSNSNTHSAYSTLWYFDSGSFSGTWHNIYNFTAGPAIRLNIGEPVTTPNLLSSIVPVENNYNLCQYSNLADAIATLPTTTNIYDSNGMNHVVDLTWIIDGFDGDIAANYQAVGSFNLPVDVIANPEIDQVVETSVLVTPVYSIIENHSICQGESYMWQGENYTDEGVYYAEYSTVGISCDSIYTLNLTINQMPQQVVIVNNPSNGILTSGTNGQISLSTSYTGTVYWVTMGAALYTSEIAGNGNTLSLGSNFIEGTYDIWSRNTSDCILLQGTVTFIEDNGLNKITANVSFGSPATNFPAGEVVVTLYKATLDIDNNPIVISEDQMALGSNGQVVFEDLDEGDYYLGSAIVNPANYNVASHVYYQTAITHEDANIIPVTENTIFVANLHHPQLVGSEGTNAGSGNVGSEGEGKSIIPEADMVVILRNDDANEIIDVCVTNENGEFIFPTIPDNTNITFHVTSFEHQNWIPYTVHTTTGQQYNVDFLIDGNSVYPVVTSNLANFEITNIVFSIFPNPAKDILQINTSIENGKVRIYDINGKIVQTELVCTQSEINISKLPFGTYVIVLTDETDKAGVIKFVKE